MLEQINFVLCGVLLPLVLCLAGIFFIFKLRGFYLLHPLRTLGVIKRSGQGFKPLCVALAGTLGVGNIVGVASAIIMGGAGSVLWMLISALIAMSLKYAEAFLSIKHRRGGGCNHYGGAPYYIADASGKRGFFIGGLFAVLCIINSLSTGALVQINSVSDLLPNGRLVFGFAFALIIFLIVLGGERRIQAVSSVIIPILTILYLALSLFIIFSNFDGLCVAISKIFSEAFSVKSALSGGVGFGISSAIRYGFTRGLLSNEAGCGTATIAHASSSLSPHSQGCLGIFEVFWDTIVLCFVTALVILIADTGEQNPILLAINSYGKLLGNFGRFFIAFSCILFALATVSCQFYYGSTSLRFLSRSRFAFLAYSAIFFSVCVISAIISSATMWQISDLVVASLAIFNLIFLVVLAKEIK